MIICMNYSTDGSRYIAIIDFVSKRGKEVAMDMALYYKGYYDEVYIWDGFNNSHKDFINEVVLKGCRI